MGDSGMSAGFGFGFGVADAVARTADVAFAVTELAERITDCVALVAREPFWSTLVF